MLRDYAREVLTYARPFVKAVTLNVRTDWLAKQRADMTMFRVVQLFNYLNASRQSSSIIH